MQEKLKIFLVNPETNKLQKMQRFKADGFL